MHSQQQLPGEEHYESASVLYGPVNSSANRYSNNRSVGQQQQQHLMMYAQQQQEAQQLQQRQLQQQQQQQQLPVEQNKMKGKIVFT